MESGLRAIDVFVCLAYLVGIVGLGAYFFRGQRSTKDFFLAGRSMGWLPVGLSLMATLTSAIGYMAQPSGAVKHGLILLGGLAALPLSYPVVVWVFMPFYHRLKLYTAYEYLERRFDVRVRCLASGIFIAWRITWMATAIYVPSLVLNTVTGNQLPLIPSVIALGVFTTLYTSLGGVKAVIWTDVAQFMIMFGGMITAAVVITFAVPGGLSEIWRTLDSGGKTAMIASIPGWDRADLSQKINLFFRTDVTLTAVIVSATVGKLAYYCVDQVMVQRYLTSKSLRTSKDAFLCNCFAYAFYIISLTLVGAGLFAYYIHHSYPSGLGNDKMFPYFIAHALPIGISGLMISSIYGASMSSLDSGVNSVVTAVISDFYHRLWRGKASLDDALGEDEQRRQLRIARVSTFVLGLAVTSLACFVGRIGDLFTICNKVINSFAGPMFGIFILGMFSKRANSLGVVFGGLLATALTALVTLAEIIGIPSLDLGFMWPSTVGLVSTLLLGYSLSLALPATGREENALTWRSVMRETMEEGLTGVAQAPGS